MTSGLEGIALAQWVYGTLTADQDLQDAATASQGPALAQRVVDGEYADPENTAWWVSFTIMEPQDIKGVGMFQVMARTQFQVKVVARGESYTPAIPIYRRVHALLEAQTNQAVGYGLVLTSQRVSGIQFPERANGMEYRHLGGTYEALGQ